MGWVKPHYPHSVLAWGYFYKEITILLYSFVPIIVCKGVDSVT